MANVRIKDLATTASSSASDDFVAIDGATNGTRKLSAYSPTFGGNLVTTGTLTVNSTTDSTSKDTGAIVTEGGLGVEKAATIGGNLTVSGTGGFGGTITSTAGNNAGLFLSTTATTGYQYFAIQSTGAAFRLGVENSSGGSLVTGSTAYDSFIGTANTSGFVIATNGATRLRIDSAGTATLAGNLTVSGTGTLANQLKLTHGFGLNDYAEVVVNAATGSSAAIRSYRYNDSFGGNEGDLRFYTNTGNVDGTQNAALRMTITGGGNVLLNSDGVDSSNGKLQLATHTTSAGGIGFGTDTSLYRSGSTALTLSGTINVAGGTLTVTNAANTANIIRSSDSSGNAVDAAFKATGTTYAIQTTDTGGNLKTALTIGNDQNATFAGDITTSQSGDANIRVTSTGTSAAYLRLTNTNQQNYGGISFTDGGSERWFIGGAGGYTGAARDFNVTVNSAYRFRINTSGTISFLSYGAGTLSTDANGVVTASSDARLKTNLRAFTRGLADVLKLSPKVYNWTKSSNLDMENDYVGFVAQDVQTAVPEAVYEGKDADKMLTLNDRALLAAVVNAIKELNAKIA